MNTNANTVAQLLNAIDDNITHKLTTQTLTRLALKGITPQAAREYLRVRALQALQSANIGEDE